eukprot:TRINITY_DN10214_c0_g2_i1.p5 TRINITY_DN10214_c0_g2~~TRINITY_DN10214_c0_g2_i1.p5  ORF type:complete len:111 (-),score=0.81 TRINITY_DN10214_c0_g2_i1:716-1048(-)
MNLSICESLGFATFPFLLFFFPLPFFVFFLGMVVLDYVDVAATMRLSGDCEPKLSTRVLNGNLLHTSVIYQHLSDKTGNRLVLNSVQVLLLTLLSLEIQKCTETQSNIAD